MNFLAKCTLLHSFRFAFPLILSAFSAFTPVFAGQETALSPNTKLIYSTARNPQWRPLDPFDYPEICGDLSCFDPRNAEWKLLIDIHEYHRKSLSHGGLVGHKVVATLLRLESLANSLRKLSSKSKYAKPGEAWFKNSGSSRYVSDTGLCYALNSVRNFQVNQHYLDSFREYEKLFYSDPVSISKKLRPVEVADLSVKIREFVLGSFVGLSLKGDRVDHAWNYNCVELRGFGANSPRRKLKTYFDISDDRKTATVTGKITYSFYDEFRLFLSRNPGIRTLAIQSYGGGVYAAMSAGRFLRLNRISTILGPTCFSACVYIYAGGVERISWSPDHLLGFHQASIDGKAVEKDDVVNRDSQRYYADMGVDPSWTHALRMSSAPEDMTTIPADESCKSGLSTYVHYGWLKQPECAR